MIPCHFRPQTTSWGPFLLGATPTGLTWLGLPPAGPGALERFCAREGLEAIHGTTPMLEEAARQLEAYLKGDLRQFSIPLDLRGTPFRRSVWEGLLRIPYGATRTYGELAQEVGRPGAARAVGGAAHANPVAIVVPCHRLVGAGGALVGFGGGLPMKERLLGLERLHV